MADNQEIGETLIHMLPAESDFALVWRQGRFVHFVTSDMSHAEADLFVSTALANLLDGVQHDFQQHEAPKPS